MPGGTVRLVTMGHHTDGGCLRQCPLPFNGGFFYIQRAPHSKGGLSEWNGPRFKRGAGKRRGHLIAAGSFDRDGSFDTDEVL